MTPGTSLVKCTVPKKVYNMVTTAESLLTHSKPQEQPHKTLSFPLAVKGLISRGEERFNPRLYTQIHTPTVVQAGVHGTHPRRFWCYVAVFRNGVTFSGKPLIFLTRWGIFYVWGRCWKPVTSPTMVAIFNFTKDLEISLKPREMIIFCALHEKYHINKNFAGF